MRDRRIHPEFVTARGSARRVRSMVFGCVLAASLLAGCAPIVHQQGHIRDAEVLAQIKPGEQSRQEVASLLGTPSAMGTFDDRRWYYISRRTETEAFYTPELVDQGVTVITFDENGVVAEVTSLSLAEARAIEPVEEESPTHGRELSFFEQIFGNIGRPVSTNQ